MSSIDFYEIVRVREVQEAFDLKVNGATGVVVGIAEDENATMYAVLVGDETCMLSASSLIATGEHADQDEIYGGQSVRVSPERYPGDQE